MQLSYNLLLISLIPLISASIGWFTNFIAIKMLFYPRKKRNFLIFSLHGVFPKRQKEMASKLGDLFAKELGVQDKISDKLSSFLGDASLKETLSNKINSLAYEFIAKEVPFLAAMAPPELINKLSIEIASVLEDNLKTELSKSANELSNKIDVKLLVQEQIEALNVEELENLLQGLLKKEFRFIEFSGAFLGFLIGCVQVLITLNLY